MNDQIREQTNNITLGALFITAYDGLRPNDEFLRFFQDVKPAGIILFADNCEDLSVLKDSLALIQQLSNRRVLVAIDQEGGRVLRVREESFVYPAASEYLSQAGSRSLHSAVDLYRDDLRRVSANLAELGVNLNLNPVCDLTPESTESALTGRTFSSDPRITALFVRAAVETQRACGLLSCLKHAPGLGRVHVDPHAELGSSEMTHAEFLTHESLPFKAGVEARAEMIMTSHFLLPEGGDTPMTFSKELVELYVRDSLSESAVLITDDLQMGALERFGGDGERALLSLRSGHDVALTRNMSAATSGVQSLERALTEETLSLQSFQRSCGKVDALLDQLDDITNGGDSHQLRDEN